MTPDQKRPYVVHVAEWAIPPDVVVIDHEHEGGVCLVASTSLGFTPEDVAEVVAEHEAECPHAKGHST